MKKFVFIIPILSILSCQENDRAADAYGNFESDEIIVSAEGNGKVLQLVIDAGDVVKKGQVLGLIDTTQLGLQKQKLNHQIEALKARMQDIPVQILVFEEQQKVMQKEIGRIKSLLQDGAATQKQLDDLEGELEVVERRMDATKSQLTTTNRSLLSEIRPLLTQQEILQDQIVKSIITAPSDGTALVRYKKPGEVALLGQPLFKMADLSTIILRVYISGDQLGQLKLGQPVEVGVDQPGNGMKSYEGTVTWVASQAEFTPKVIQTKEERTNLVYAVKILVENDGELKIGMPAEINMNNE